MILRFNKLIYSRLALEKTIKAYKNLAKFSIKEKGNYFVVECKDLIKRSELFEKEFKNYALTETAN